MRLDIVNMDPEVYPPQLTKQTMIDDAYTKKRIILANSLPSGLTFTEFQSIQPKVHTSKAWYCQFKRLVRASNLLRRRKYISKMVELRDAIKSLKKQGDLYEVTLMCDS